MLEPKHADPDDYRVLPPDCLSREELERRFPRPLPFRPPIVESRPRLRYSLGELLVVTTGISVTLAGGFWMPPEIYAAALGMITLLGLFVVTWHPPETRLAKLLWSLLVIAYFFAVATAAFKASS